MMPGTASPGRDGAAMSMGLDVVKFFPAEQKRRRGQGEGPGPALYQSAAGCQPWRREHQRTLMDYMSFDKIVACGGTWMVKKDLIEGRAWWDENTRICREAVQTMLGFELRHVGINCDNEAEAEKTARIFCALFQLPYKPGATPPSSPEALWSA